MLDPFSVTYGEIRGMLSAFASLSFNNGPANMIYDFDFTYVEKIGTAQDTVKVRFADIADTVTLVPLANWREIIQPVLEVWLFDSLILPSFSKTYWSQVIVDLVDKIERLVCPIAAWRIDIHEDSLKGYYQNLWEDFALESEQAIFFLHLGFYD